MSKLGAALKSHSTNREVARPPKYFHLTEDFHPSSAAFTMDRQTVYQLGAEFRTQFMCSPNDGEGMTRAVDTCRKQILLEIFGEFMPPLHEAKYLLLSGKDREAADLIDKVITGMMSTEPMKP
jgi:hypothetical protein